ncbi:MAG: bifunctional (p)ppGpp synthetase/guanosine-3',5'-bis(diphosphate) 3'-pyrophosphohydrolase [Thermoanaerobaculia bacterium]|nr:bifunctional (p)ppGpp synthetase/guanosine-3',5'-bis(diphosphate) 3'-pyrophosphohydrolase [Thermoanaerobaculia bacterium]
MAAALNRSRKTAPPPFTPRAKIDLAAVISCLERQERSFDEELIRSTHDFSLERHKDQKRRSGEPYFTHPLYVAYLLADWGFDELCVAVGMLHDVLEDTLTSPEVLAERFGDEIAELVDGVTKIGRHEYVRKDQVQAETFRKLILASVEDIRVILVKLADRLHNMMTLEHMPAEARERISRETMEIYAPIAHRLGMSKVQGELEDLAFYHLQPERYAELVTGLQQRMKVSKGMTHRIRDQLRRRLREAGIEAEIGSRVKHLRSIYRKLRQRGIDISGLYDYLAYRIITERTQDCYAALGVVHQNWRPVPGRFKDYIAMPKPNMYQSLHTTVLAREGEPFEVQIRTAEMDRVAEQGIAAHWRYKHGQESKSTVDAGIVWLRQLLEWQKEVPDPRNFLATLKVDLYPDEVYAFSPKGDVFSFPRGATPLDFAYRIHTEVGHGCVGALVNGRMVPLKTPLQNGDIVEILTKKRGEPKRDWLQYVVTSRAKSKIRNWLNAQQKKESMEIGRRALEKELRRYRVAPKRVYESEALQEYLTSEGLARVEDMLSRIGFGTLSAQVVASRVLSEEQLAQEEEPGRLRQVVNRVLPFGSSAVSVRGHGDLLAYLAKCCNPLPGEEIVGFITRGRGVSVHSARCKNVENLLYNPEREIEVTWAKPRDEVYPVVLDIVTEDRPGMLARLTEVVAKNGANIRQIEAEAIETGRGLIEVVMEVRDQKHLRKIREGIEAVAGVIDVSRKQGPLRGSPQPSG